MDQRTCRECGNQLRPRVGAHGLCGTCYSTWYRRTHPGKGRTLYTATCVACGTAFTSKKPGATFCSTANGSCQVTGLRSAQASDLTEEKLERRRFKRLAADLLRPPARAADYRRAMRSDPCAYCGERPANGIDHIEPTGADGDRADWTNWTGSCKRCNETKRDLPLLLALPWIPLSRNYHDQRRTLFVSAVPHPGEGPEPA